MQIRSNDVTAILDACLERMRRGESIEACLYDYPAEAEEIEPLLVAAMCARSTFRPPPLSPQARQAIQRKLHQAVAARQPAPHPVRSRWFGSMAVRFVLALVVALISLGGGVAAAQSSLPGSMLYPLKRGSESVRLRLASSPTQRAKLHLEFAAARSGEILALANNGQATVDSSIVDDLDGEYQLAWEEIAQVPANQIPDLVNRYIIERRADVQVFSSTLTHLNAAAKAQIQRAVGLGEQALKAVDPAKPPVPQPDLDRGASTGNGNNRSDESPVPSAKPADTGPKATPKATPERKPANAGPKATPERKPANAGPKATPEGQPDTAGPKATPEGKPDTAGPKATPEGKPDTKPDDKPDNAGPKPKPTPRKGKP